MSLINGPGVSNAAAFLVLATDGLNEAERATFLRETLAYSATMLRELHGPRVASMAVYAIADEMVGKGGA